jgi:hypothetical protein
MSWKSCPLQPQITLGIVMQVPLVREGCGLVGNVPFLQWPRDITAAVISESNPTGMLTNSDLEMAAVVLQLNVLESLA